MVLEATMICIDNSDWMRNGDYAPTRMQAQTDAVSLICGAKTQSNPENTVGVMTIAGKGARVLVTPTPDLGKVLSCMHGIGLDGRVNLLSSVQIAQLALKHRQNKNQRQRIVLFVGSPIDAEAAQLVRIGKKLRKNNVAVDVVNFGGDDETAAGNAEKLEAFVGAVNSNDNSHLVTVPVGVNHLSDALLSSPVFTADVEGGMAPYGAAGGGAAEGFEFGVDPNLDPELALALRVSMEEERARQEAAAKQREEAAKEAAGGDTAMKDATGAGVGADGEASGSGAAAVAAGSAAVDEATPMDNEDALLQQALAMSLGAGIGGDGAARERQEDQVMADLSGEDADLALALQLSMQAGGDGGGGRAGEAEAAGAGAGAGAADDVARDPAFVSSVLSSLPGVDPNDPAVQQALASISGGGGGGNGEGPVAKGGMDEETAKEEKDDASKGSS